MSHVKIIKKNFSEVLYRFKINILDLKQLFKKYKDNNIFEGLS